MTFPPASRLRTAGIAIAFAIGLLVASHQLAPHETYAIHGAYRAQVDALLSGRMALSESPDGLAHDLAWTQSGVQQVWGLGVPMWQLPFEAVGRAIGVTPFPDRVALVAWLALVAYLVLRAARRYGEGEAAPRTVAVGTAILALLLPGIVSLVRTRLGVYEEAAVYAYGAGIALFAGTVAFAKRPTLIRYLALLAFAGAVGFFRPTVWFYGAATAAIASGVWLRARGRRGIAGFALAAALFTIGGAGLYWTNARRFGDGMEFGHRVNLEGLLAGNVYATRFTYPFQRVGVVAATEELVGAAFGRPEGSRSRGFFARGLSRGEANVVRWREYYFTTYTWAYVPLLLAGFVLGARAWRRRTRGAGQIDHLLWLWAILGTGPLAVFYLHSPSLSSRYLLDLAPGFVALLVIAWRAFAIWLARYRHGAVGALGVLGVAWGFAVVTAHVYFPRTGAHPLDRAAAAPLGWVLSRPVPYDHVVADGFDFDCDLYANTASASEHTWERCADADGRALASCADVIAGDTIVRGVEDPPRSWTTTTSTVVDDDAVDAAALADAERVCVADEDDGVCHREIAEEPREVAMTGPVLYLNAANLDPETGRTPPATFFYVQDVGPRVEIDVSGGDPAKVFAVIDRVHLPVIGGADLANGVTRVIFAVPEALPGLRVMFLAFGDDTEFDRRWSEFTIHRVHWRN